jgi:hypothetical protein
MVALGLSDNKLSTTNRFDSRYEWHNILGASHTAMSAETQSDFPSKYEFLAGSHDKSHSDREF